jgi:hypothetical protein
MRDECILFKVEATVHMIFTREAAQGCALNLQTRVVPSYPSFASAAVC